MSDQPPPPPPHGTNPRSSTNPNLPPGKYDIFIIPPHSSGAGFLYLPSMKPNVNSFAAGFASALVLVVLFQSMAPAFRVWWSNFQGMGNMGMLFLVIAVGVGAWALGRTQNERGPSQGGNGGTNHSWSYNPGSGGHSGGSHPGAGSSSSSRPPDPDGPPPPPPPHGSPPPRQSGPPPETHGSEKPRASWQQQQQQQQRPDADTSSQGSWEKAREETRKKEEEKKAKEAEQRKKEADQRRREQVARRVKELREKEAREKAKREKEAKEKREQEERERNERERLAREKQARETRAREAQEREAKEKAERDLREKLAKEKAEKEAREAKERAEREAREAREKAEREAREAKEKAEREAREREQREKEERERAQKEKAQKEKELRERRAQEARERVLRDRLEHEKTIREKLEREAKEREAARLKEAQAAKAAEAAAEAKAKESEAPRKSTYAFSSVGEKTNPWPNGKPPAQAPPSPKPAPSTASTPTPNAARRPPPPTAKSFRTTDEDAYSYRPYDHPKAHSRRRSGETVFTESSYAASQSTSRTTPPPSMRAPYSTKDPAKIVIKAVYAFLNQYSKTPASQLLSGLHPVTDGLILRITTEGLFIDDDLRGVPQREWDVKAWTLKTMGIYCPSQTSNGSNPGRPANKSGGRFKSSARGQPKPLTGDDAKNYLDDLLDSCKDNCRLGPHRGAKSTHGGEWKQRGLHVLQATLKDAEGKRYLFVMPEEEGWKVAVALQRLREGSQARQLGMGIQPMTAEEAGSMVENVGW
ncbi:hypothetical protein F5Y18DRAFT_62851 [Xylariaceae sp. FL1019]|nr:hypothetical protein F5Y18DRAFT_62851 [Xylariaceae sp. FL1019]